MLALDTRFLQRIDVQANQADIREAFDGWQYCACLPGGTECLGWMARLCWDKGIPFVVGDVPNGFPGVKLSEVYEALSSFSFSMNTSSLCELLVTPRSHT